MTIAHPPTLVESPQHIVLEDVSWEFYEHLLREIGDRAIRATFHQGRLEIMSPLPAHERWKRTIGRLIEMLAFELNLPMCCLGSTTWRRKEGESGLEPDECCYLQSAASVRGKSDISLEVDPPPDLALEIDITHRSIKRQPVYAALGIPELWRFDGKRLTFLRLDSNGKYKVHETSLAFPFLRTTDLEPFIDVALQSDDTELLRSFQQWVRQLPHE